MVARRRADRGALVPGLLMIVVGTVFLLERFDYISMRQAWDLWPGLLIALGAMQLLWPRHGRRSIFLLLLGIWLQINVLDLWDLDWDDSWPLLIIFIGASFVFDALFNRGGYPEAEVLHASGAPSAGGGGPQEEER
ncbi:MAG: DUF5668 domain-containing protein [Acidobacteriota bacterium]|jgi:hypothetical protein